MHSSAKTISVKEAKEREFTKQHGPPVRAGRMGLRRPIEAVSDESDNNEDGNTRLVNPFACI